MVTLPTSKLPPSLLEAKLTVASTPSPAERVPPENENPTTIPVAELKVASPKSEATPVKSTPSVSNWKPPISKLEEYKISADWSVTEPKLNATLPHVAASIQLPAQSKPSAAPSPPHSPHSSSIAEPPQ